MSEWLISLCGNNGTWGIDGPRDGTPELIHQLKEVSNPISHAVDFCIDRILRGYITEFVIDYTKSYSATKREFFYKPRDKYLRELDVWIKMALRDFGAFPMRNDS